MNRSPPNHLRWLSLFVLLHNRANDAAFQALCQLLNALLRARPWRLQETGQDECWKDSVSRLRDQHHKRAWGAQYTYRLTQRRDVSACTNARYH